MQTYQIVSSRRARRGERGVTMVAVVVALAALIGAAAVALDVGVVWNARNQLQEVADAAALAAAWDAYAVSPADEAAGTAAAVAVAQQNTAVPATAVDILPSDVVYGYWDVTNPNPTLESVLPIGVTGFNAVQVTARLDSQANSPVPGFLGRLFGRNAYNVQASAIAYRGLGGGGNGVASLPIAIDCCKLGTCSPDGSTQEVCDAIDPPPNPCQIPDVAGTVTGSCLEFAPTGVQNACWITFSDDTPSVNVPVLSDIVGFGGTDFDSDGEPDEHFVGEQSYVDNGTKTPIVRDIHDKMLGEGPFAPASNAEGQNRYNPDGTTIDSWVVTLPVINCQSDDHCAGGDAATIVGFVCFEIRQVLVTPEKIIKGQFLCPDDPDDQVLIEDPGCHIGNLPGGIPNGVTPIPVLVQ